MLDYARRMKEVVSERSRLIAIKGAGGIIALIGAGFLLAALWTYLADNLDWGPLGASLAIGTVFMILGLLAIVLSGRPRKVAPTADDLRAEVQERVGLATDVILDRVTGRAEDAFDRVRESAEATVNKARSSAEEAISSAKSAAQGFVDSANQRVHSFVDSVNHRADSMAEKVDDEALRFAGTAQEKAEDLGLSAENIQQSVDRFKNSAVGTWGPVVGAFAVGMTLANRFRHKRDDDDEF